MANSDATFLVSNAPPSDSTDERPLRGPWRRAVPALAALYVLHIAYAVFWMWPARSTDFGPVLGTMAAGAVLSQPALMALIGALAHGHLGIRFIVSASLAVIMGYAMIIGGIRSDGIVPRMHVQEMSSVVISYFVFLLPALVFRRQGHLRLLPATSRDGQGGQFSIAGLLVATAWIATVIGIGRWVWLTVSWQSSSGVTVEQWTVAGIVATMIAWCCLPMLPLTALVLGGRRARAAVTLLATIVVAVGGLYVVLYQVTGRRGMLYFGEMIAGAHLSALASLLVLRWSGFRLVREVPPRLLPRSQSDGNTFG